MMVQLDTLSPIQPLLPSDHTLLWCWEYLDSPWKGEESLETSTRRDETNRQPNKLSCRFGTVPTSKAAQPPWQPATIQAMMVIEPWQLNWLRHWRYLARRLGFQAQLGWIHSRQPQYQLCWMPMHRLDCSCTPRHSQLWTHLRLGERGLTTSRSSIVHFTFIHYVRQTVRQHHGSSRSQWLCWLHHC